MRCVVRGDMGRYLWLGCSLLESRTAWGATPYLGRMLYPSIKGHLWAAKHPLLDVCVCFGIGIQSEIFRFSYPCLTRELLDACIAINICLGFAALWGAKTPSKQNSWSIGSCEDFVGAPSLSFALMSSSGAGIGSPSLQLLGSGVGFHRFLLLPVTSSMRAWARLCWFGCSVLLHVLW